MLIPHAPALTPSLPLNLSCENYPIRTSVQQQAENEVRS